MVAWKLAVSLLFLAHGCPEVAGASSVISTDFYSKNSGPFRTTLAATVKASSRVSCASACSSDDSCRYLDWSSESQECSLYRVPRVDEPSVWRNDLIKKKTCFAKSESLHGACHCNNGFCGSQCDQPFSHALQQVDASTMLMYSVQDAVQLEWGGGSFILFAGSKPIYPESVSSLLSYGFSPATGTYTLLPSIGDLTYLSSVQQFTVQSRYYLFLTSGDVAANTTATESPQTLMTLDVNNAFIPIQTWTEAGVSGSAVFRRSSGDVYLCSVVREIASGQSTPGMKIFKFDAVGERLQQVYAVNVSGTHDHCVFVEISGVLYALGDTRTDVTTTLHYLSPDDTWQPYQNITDDSPLSGLSVAYSSQIGTHVLAVGQAGAQRVAIFTWNQSHFTLLDHVPVAIHVVNPYLLEVGNQLFLLVDIDEPDATSSLSIFTLESGRFVLHSVVSNSKPSGGFRHFWFQDRLYLMVLHRFNPVSSHPVLHYVAYQQLFRWD